MSFKVKKLIVGKGRTISNEKAGEWVKQYYQLEIEIQDEHDLEIAKASVEGLIDGWLTSQDNGPLPQHGNVETWNPQAIKWVETEGSKGPYQRSEDVNNLEFKALLKDLASHNGKLTRDGWFFWAFQNGHIIGRKKRK